MNTEITAIFSLIGVVVGASLQSLLARKNEKRKQITEWRNKSYVDFLEAVSVVATTQRKKNASVTNEQLSRLADAKSRICIYGEADIIKELADFWRHGATLETESELLAFSRFCLKIRKSIGVPGDIEAYQDITQLLFSIDIKQSAASSRVHGTD
ncbi:MAG: hypothetical protein PHI97_28030 [Desulfobulbus sp.]|nr:hypothetical protein [Desulfobulbus sp.]